MKTIFAAIFALIIVFSLCVASVSAESASPSGESSFVPADIDRAVSRMVGYSAVALVCLAAVALIIIKTRKKKK